MVSSPDHDQTAFEQGFYAAVAAIESQTYNAGDCFKRCREHRYFTPEGSCMRHPKGSSFIAGWKSATDDDGV